MGPTLVPFPFSNSLEFVFYLFDRGTNIIIDIPNSGDRVWVEKYACGKEKPTRGSNLN